jgi:hypothetical protein
MGQLRHRIGQARRMWLWCGKYHVAAGTELSKGRGCRDTVLLEGGAPGTTKAIRGIIQTVQRSGIGFYNHESAIVGLPPRTVSASQCPRVVYTVILFLAYVH